jgi:heme exporter protein C
MKLYSKSPIFALVAPLAALATVAVLAAMYLIFVEAPVERTMGIVQKIFYFHVPSAIAAYAGFFGCCAASVVYLLRGDPRADAVARACAEVGVLFCAFVLISGPLWARKAWGTWWTGEPRLLLTLVLVLIFVAYLLVREFGPRSELTRRICAALAILGVVDIPLVRISVERWRGNHPVVLERSGGGGLAPGMGDAFTAGMIAVACLFALVLLLRVRAAFLDEDADRLHRAATSAAHRADSLRRDGVPA